MNRIARTLLFAFGTAAIEVLPPLALHATGRGLMLVGRGLQRVGRGVEILGNDALVFAERQRMRGAYYVAGGSYPYPLTTPRVGMPERRESHFPVRP